MITLLEDPRVARAHYIATLHDRNLVVAFDRMLARARTMIATEGRALTPDDLRSALFGRRVTLTREHKRK